MKLSNLTFENMPSCDKRSNVKFAPLDAQPLAAFGPPAGEDSLALLGRHAAAKAMPALAPEIAWIVGAFRHRA